MRWQPMALISEMCRGRERYNGWYDIGMNGLQSEVKILAENM